MVGVFGKKWINADLLLSRGSLRLDGEGSDDPGHVTQHIVRAEQ